MLKDTLTATANSLIDKYGNDGTLDLNDASYDPITGETTGVASTISLKYTAENYQDHELVEGAVLSGDSKLTIKANNSGVIPTKNMFFLDYTNVKFAIMSVTPTGTQNAVIIYELQVRHSV